MKLKFIPKEISQDETIKFFANEKFYVEATATQMLFSAEILELTVVELQFWL